MIRRFPHSLMTAGALVMMGAGVASAQNVVVPPSQPVLPVLPGPGSLPLPGGAATPSAPAPAAPAVAMPVLPATAPTPPAPAAAPGASTAKIPALPQATKDLPVLPVKKGTDTPAKTTEPDTSTTTTPAAQTKVFSYGRSNTSVLFLPNQVTRMKEAISFAEITNANNPAKPKIVAPVETVKAPVEQIKEPDNYPVFYLSSIAYNTPSDWSLWVSGHKITSRKNDTDVQVIGVSREGATFSWKPAYADAISRRRQAKQFAPTDAVKNKLAAAQKLSQDDTSSVVTFSLKQNQTFTVSYFSIFEGYMEGTKVPVYTGVDNNNVVNFDTPPNGTPGMTPPMPSAVPGQPVPRMPTGNAATNAAMIQQAESSLMNGTPMNVPPAPGSPTSMPSAAPMPSAPLAPPSPPGLTH